MTKRAKPGSSGLADFTSEHDYFDYGNGTSKTPKPVILNSEVTIIEPGQKLVANQNPAQLDFDLISTKAILCGPLTRFQVKGHFERKKPPAPAVEGVDPPPPPEWTKIPVADADEEATKVLLAPGWWEYLVKSVDVFHNNTKVATSSESKYVVQHMNRFLDALQDKEVLHLSAPQACHPNRLTVPLTANSVHLPLDKYPAYLREVFVNEPILFDWYPRGVWPFQQGVNFLADGDMPRAVPMPLLGGKLSVRVSFAEDWSTIFRKSEGNRNEYRFVLTHFRLLVEEARLSVNFEKALFSTKKTLHFPGVARKMEWVTIPAESTTFNMRFHETMLPEGVLVFCLDKKVPNGTYSFAADNNRNIFRDHHVKTIEISFNNERFSIKDPQPGDLGDDMFDNLRLIHHTKIPLFGVKPDKKALNLEVLKQGGRTASSFPHIFYPLTLLGVGNEAKRVPIHNDGSCLGKRGNLDIFLKFVAEGAARDVIYVFVIYFTDKNLSFDCKNKLFFSPHGVPQY